MTPFAPIYSPRADARRPAGPTTNVSEFPTAADRAEIAGRGIAMAEIERQLSLLAKGVASARLDRPCRLEDGVVRLAPEDWNDLEREWEQAAKAGRLLKFVPASGAATRMFAFLQPLLDARGVTPTTEIRRFLDHLDRMPFVDDPSSGAYPETGQRDPREVARFLLTSAGADLGNRPKGLLPFHAYADGCRTALAEHFYEATHHLGPSGGPHRMHFTVSPAHRAAFEAAARELTARLAGEGEGFEVDFSTQGSSTDTLALGGDGAPARTADGRLVFRPAGHGALIGNLEQTGDDVVFVKNIDNIARHERHGENGAWKRRLAGYLLRLQKTSWELLKALERNGTEDETVERAAAFVGGTLGATEPATGNRSAEAHRRWLIERLDRPLRVVGVVRNQGEPGGGPFWVAGPENMVMPQIVEASQVDTSDPEQRRIWEAATHFNPVDLVCALRDRHGNAYSLDRYVDPEASMISVKREGDREIRVLERPGLWNGAMAGWSTVFVEVPAETFTPVKTALDLLRPEHQPG